MKKPKKKKQQQDATPSPAQYSATTVGNPVAEWPVTDAEPAESSTEPLARSAAVPALVFAILGLLLFWGDLHLVSQGGEMDPRVHYPFASVREVDSLHIKAAVDPRISKGEGLYNLICKACHQEDGQGGVAQGCPPLAGSDWVLTKDPSRMAAIVIKGLTGPIVVSGKTYGTGTMTPFGDSLNDDDIASVLSYVRNNWSNKAPLVDATDVKKARAQFKDRPGYMDASELLKMVLRE